MYPFRSLTQPLGVRTSITSSELSQNLKKNQNYIFVKVSG